MGVEMKEEAEEREKIELFFCNVYEFLTDFASFLNPVPCPVISPVGTPVAVTNFLQLFLVQIAPNVLRQASYVL